MNSKCLALAGVFLLTILPLRTLAQQQHQRRDLAPDQPGEEEDINRELWEFAKDSPYTEAQRYVSQSQLASVAARPTARVLSGLN